MTLKDDVLHHQISASLLQHQQASRLRQLFYLFCNPSAYRLAMDQTFRAPQPPNPSNLANGDRPSSSKDSQTLADRDGHPTHHIHDVKLHKNSVQLLVSTEDHLYDSRRVELEESSWQCKGTMNDTSIQALVAAVTQRRETGSSQTKVDPVASSFQIRQRLGRGGS